MSFHRAALVVSALLFAVGARAQDSNFLGVLAGISTLSADGRSVTTPSASNISLYKPENGPALQVVAGRHLGHFLSVQAGYGWNRNDLTLTSSRTAEGPTLFYEQSRRAAQHTVLGELMLYFRRRGSFARPYLSVGAGIVHLASGQETIEQTVGQLTPVPGSFSSTKPALRVAVGIDLFVRNGWAFRFAFTETIRNNAISAQLTPPAERNLANFQNCFGFVKHF